MPSPNDCCGPSLAVGGLPAQLPRKTDRLNLPAPSLTGPVGAGGAAGAEEQGAAARNTGRVARVGRWAGLAAWHCH